MGKVRYVKLGASLQDPGKFSKVLCSSPGNRNSAHVLEQLGRNKSKYSLLVRRANASPYLPVPSLLAYKLSCFLMFVWGNDCGKKEQ